MASRASYSPHIVDVILNSAYSLMSSMSLAVKNRRNSYMYTTVVSTSVGRQAKAIIP